MRVGLRLNGKVIGIDPNDRQFSVYANRDRVGAWEEGELTRHSDGHFDFRFLASNRQLSLAPGGRLESRAAGTFGPWEQLWATTQPDGLHLLYRAEGMALLPVLTIEEVE
jgi:hypothetical protein